MVFITSLGPASETSWKSKPQEDIPGLFGKELLLIKHLVCVWMGLGDWSVGVFQKTWCKVQKVEVIWFEAKITFP